MTYKEIIDPRKFVVSTSTETDHSFPASRMLSDYVPQTTFTPTVTPTAGTWTGQSVLTARYTKIGKTVIVMLSISGTASQATTHSVTIPGGYTAAFYVETLGRDVQNNAAFFASSTAGGTTILCAPLAGNFPVGAVNIRFVLTFEVQ